MEEYLRTSYEYDAEWVGGEVVERSLPTYSHARAERRIVRRLANSEAQARLFASPNQRVQISACRWRILSPEDSMSSLLDKLAEFAAAGIQHLWVVDPGHALLLEYVGRGLAEVEAIEFPDRGFRLTAQEIFG